MGEHRVLSGVRASVARALEKSRLSREHGQIQQILNAFGKDEELSPYQVHQRTHMNFGRLYELLTKMEATGLLASAYKRFSPHDDTIPQRFYKKVVTERPAVDA